MRFKTETNKSKSCFTEKINKNKKKPNSQPNFLKERESPKTQNEKWQGESNCFKSHNPMQIHWKT